MTHILVPLLLVSCFVVSLLGYIDATRDGCFRRIGDRRTGWKHLVALAVTVVLAVVWIVLEVTHGAAAVVP